MSRISVAGKPPSRRTLPTRDQLVSGLIALKWAELDALAAMLQPSLRSAAPVAPIEWVARLAELATIHDLAGRLEGDYRQLAGADSVPQRGTSIPID